MPRSPRFIIPGQPHHVTQRGVNRAALFVATEDRLHFRECLAAACRRHECALHAYVFMTNHVHLLITPPSALALSSAMRLLGNRYARYFNHASDRRGPLYEDRYRASIVDSAAYVLACYRYIELNPVRAGLSHAPADYEWSSYRRNALGHGDALVRPHAVFTQLGGNDQRRRAAYRALFDDALAPETLRAIRGATPSNGPTVSRAAPHHASRTTAS